MTDDGIRYAVAIGWLIDRLSKAENRPVWQVASELLIYVEQLDTDLRKWKERND